MIAVLGEHCAPAEATIAAGVLREYGGTIPDEQLLSEIGLAIWRRAS